uniref:Uncharacterized protein n=1 Tax=Megaselia scalaris TaxID=36166 RepID=T1GHW9_MEGSC
KNKFNSKVSKKFINIIRVGTLAKSRLFTEKICKKFIKKYQKMSEGKHLGKELLTIEAPGETLSSKRNVPKGSSIISQNKLMGNNLYGHTSLFLARGSSIINWKRAMSADPCVQSFFLDSKTHAKYFESKWKGYPDYDMLL